MRRIHHLRPLGRQLLPWLLAVALSMGLIACSDDSDDVGSGSGSGAETSAGEDPFAIPDGGTPSVDDTGSEGDAASDPDGSEGGGPDGSEGGDSEGGTDIEGGDSEGGSDTEGGEDAEGGADGETPDTEDPPFDAGPLDIEVIAEREDTSWAAVWHAEVDHPGLRASEHAPATPHYDATVMEQFGGTATPPEGQFLLHAYEGWDEPDRPAVLLVHGSGSYATITFGDLGLGVPGLASWLSTSGLAVFAITFPHPFGDVRNQAIELAAAIQLAREQIKATDIALVAHSKGGLAAVAYAGGRLEVDGLIPQGEISAMAMLGSPLGGMDYTFRHPAASSVANFWGTPVPTAWEEILVGFEWTDTFDDSIYHPGYLGLQQLLTPWVDSYPLTMLEQDWFTSYYGGLGFVSSSRGIDETVELGGSFMASLADHPVPSNIRSALVAGSTSIIGGVAWETSGPSDGLVFVASAHDTSLFAAPDGVVTQLFPLATHPTLVTSPDIWAWLSGWLLNDNQER